MGDGIPHGCHPHALGAGTCTAGYQRQRRPTHRPRPTGSGRAGGPHATRTSDGDAPHDDEPATISDHNDATPYDGGPYDHYERVTTGDHNDARRGDDESAVTTTSDDHDNATGDDQVPRHDDESASTTTGDHSDAHRTDIEADRGRLKSGLRPMRSPQNGCARHK